MVASWLLVRHGPTAWSTAGVYAGWSDVSLDDAGRDQAGRLARRLAAVRLGAAYASDLSRARQTLDLLLAGRDDRPRVRFDPDLRELHFGAWEGQTYATIAAQPEGPAVLAGEGAAPDGESLGDLAVRVGRFAAHLQGEAAPEREGATLVVAHGGPLRVLLCLLLGLPPAAHWRFQLDHSSLSEIHWDESTGARLVRLNDRCHLEDSPRSEVQGPRSKVQGPRSEMSHSRPPSEVPRPASPPLATAQRPRLGPRSDVPPETAVVQASPGGAGDLGPWTLDLGPPPGGPP